MVRKLSPLDYGVLNSLFSVLTFFSVPALVVQMVLMRYVSRFLAQQKEGEVRALFFSFGKAILIFSGVLVLVFLFQARALANFLNIEEKGLMYLVGLSALLSTGSMLCLGILSGFQKFTDVAWSNSISTFIKLGMGIGLVVLGFKVWGALLGVVLSFAAAFIYSYQKLPSWTKKIPVENPHIRLDYRGISSYFVPVALSMLCFFLLTNIDIILVKHYFDPLNAGYYSVAQTVGKIVLFIPSAIGIVMFPKVVDAHARNKGHLRILKKCLLAVGALCGATILFSLFFPDLILKVLTGHSQPLAISLVKFFAINMGLLALCNILMLYHLSLHRMPFIYFMVFAAVLQAAGIAVFHASLEQVLWVVLLCSFVLFIVGLKMIRPQEILEKS